MTIEDLILADDGRGISALRPHLPSEYCIDTARFVLDRPGPVLIATGFYILSGRAVETDGPPGAVALGNAFESLGHTVAYVTDANGTGVVRSAAGPDAHILAYPVGDFDASEQGARDVLAAYQPSLMLSIERCAPSADGVYRNMRGADITPYTARVDRLFNLHDATVGIGDGGNEIGMGLFAEEIAAAATLPDQPAVTRTTKLIIASVSNWGAWGLLAAMSRLTDRDLLPTVDQEAERVRRCVEAGAVDGFSGERVARVDGRELADYCKPLTALRELLGLSS